MNRNKKDKDIIINKIELSKDTPQIKIKRYGEQEENYLELFENKEKKSVPETINNDDDIKELTNRMNKYVKEDSMSEREDESDIEKKSIHREEKREINEKRKSRDKTPIKLNEIDLETEIEKTDVLDKEEISDDEFKHDSDEENEKKKYDSDEENEKKSLKSEKKKYDSDEANESKEPEKKKVPKLSEINNGSFIPKKIIEDLDYSKDDEEDLKRELLFKIEILKKKYKSINFPEFNIHTDYKLMLREYEDSVKRLNIDSNTEKYRKYLIWGFYIIQFVLGNYMKFDMTGFVEEQLNNMNSYDALLVELGEKNYQPEASNYPVEVRLIFTMLIQTAFFLVPRMLLGNSFPNLSVGAPVSKQPQQTKKTMRGPSSLFN